MAQTMKMPKITVSQEKIVPILVVVIVIAAVLFFIKPTWSKYTASKQAVAAEKQDIAALQDKQATLDNLNADDLNQQLTEARAALPETKDVAGVIAGISRIAQENNLTISALTLKPGKLSTDSAYQKVAMKVSLDGDMQNVDAFMKKLGEVRRIMGIDSYSGTGGVSGVAFTSALSINFYTLPLPTDLGKYSDPLPNYDSTKKDLITKLSQMPVYTDVSAYTPTAPAPSASPIASKSATIALPQASGSATTRP